MQLLISDANILIDIEEGKIVDKIFSLPYQFITPDILYYEELEDQHSHLIEQGLLLASLTPESVDHLQTIIINHAKPSRYDCMALVLAQQEECPLLTGDKDLRLSAEVERVEVKGTIWLVEQLVTEGIITIDNARESYQLMEACDRRLPFPLAYERLNNLI